MFSVPKFEFFQKGRKYEQNGDWFWRGVGRVKTIQPAAKPEGFFAPGTKQTVVDSRFRSTAPQIGALIYQTTSASLPPTNDPALQEKFAAEIEGRRNARPPKDDLNTEY